jgi:hypothetical protein
MRLVQIKRNNSDTNPQILKEAALVNMYFLLQNSIMKGKQAKLIKITITVGATKATKTIRES